MLTLAAMLLLLSTPTADAGSPPPAQAAAAPAPTTGDLSKLREGLRALWQECLFDRADALAGDARMPPERAVERALAGCEEKAREFRRMATRTIPERGRAKFLSKVDGEMKQYALVVARAAAAVPP